jgi:hypothetical protein
VTFVLRLVFAALIALAGLLPAEPTRAATPVDCTSEASVAVHAHGGHEMAVRTSHQMPRERHPTPAAHCLASVAGCCAPIDLGLAEPMRPTILVAVAWHRPADPSIADHAAEPATPPPRA